MYHHVLLGSPGAHTNFWYDYLENCTMNLAENHMVLKWKCCIMHWTLINFVKGLIIISILKKIAFKYVN